MNTEKFNPGQPATFQHHQRGAVLFISLIMLLVMTLIGVTGMQSSSMEEKMVANMRDINLSFQAAEAALREAETSLQAAVLNEFDGSNTGLYQPATAGDPPLWEVAATWSPGSYIPYSKALLYVSEQPKYIIEELPPVPDPDGSAAADEPLPEAGFYRVTTRGLGGSDKAITILQAVYER